MPGGPPLEILVVDDDALVRAGLQGLLAGAGHAVVLADGVRSGIAAFKRSPPALAIVDQQLGDGTAFDLFDAFQTHDPRVPILVLTGSANVENAVEAMKRGARDFLTKPARPAQLLAAVDAALASRRPAGGEGPPDPFAGSSRVVRELAGEASRVAASSAPVLITGETGTGKGVLARWLHAHSPRASGPFLDLNCAGLSAELLDSELFGHERGAFTGAVSAKVGLLEAASGGTVFLDEIGDIDLGVQGRILKAIEERRFRRVGGVKDLTVDIRLVAATHRDLAERVQAGAFRQDLFFRVSTLPLALPALRDRLEDLPVLAERLLARGGARPVTLSPEALERLRAHGWPGNVRELRNVLERALVLSDGEVLRPQDLRLDARPAPTAAGATLEEVERAHILRVLADEDYRVAEAAERLGIPRSTLYQRLKVLGLQLPRSRRRIRDPDGG
ncbi:MAG: sigma-54 dependent transcriptional regulator [Anaeromyxobacter sp.]